MKELYRICVEKPNHKFCAYEYFKEIDICPYCKCHMDLVEIEINERPIRNRSLRRATRDKDAVGYNRSLKIDLLPRLEWFSEAIDLNEVEQEKSRDTWTIDDAMELLELYRKYGVANAQIWNGLASDIGRSLYAVERQLRITMHCADELEKHYPPAKPIKLAKAKSGS